MKLAQLLETISDAKRLALHLQQLALEHNFEYELDYRPAMHVNTTNKIQAIELTLPKRQVADIIDGLRANASTHPLVGEGEAEYKELLGKLGVFIVIGELSATMNVFNGEEDPVEQYVDDDIEELVKQHIAPYSQYTTLS